MIKNLLKFCLEGNFKNKIKSVDRRLKKVMFGLKIKEFEIIKECIINKKGLEIGGSSGIFKKNDVLPVYDLTKNIDNVNFAEKTVWQDVQGENFFGKGKQYILEASNLKGLENQSYDFVISSHCLEHCANTIKVLQEWLRVLKENGLLLLVIPDHNTTMDHKRPITSFEHIIHDFKDNVGEDDLTHLDEILKLHDLKKDCLKGDYTKFKERCLKNKDNRCMHQHVFDEELIKKMFELLHLKILFIKKEYPIHLIAAGIKQ